MSNKCELTGVQVMFGNKVSYSNKKFRRIFKPNLHKVWCFSNTLNIRLKLKISMYALRGIEKSGGFDEYLRTLKRYHMSKKIYKLKKKILHHCRQ